MRPHLPRGILAQHGHIRSHISALGRAHATGATWEDLAQRVDELLEDVRLHFEHEEEEMAKAGYTQLEEHRGAHTTFLRRLRVLREECRRRETELMGMFIDLLENWFDNHERTADAHVIQSMRVSDE